MLAARLISGMEAENSRVANPLISCGSLSALRTEILKLSEINLPGLWPGYPKSLENVSKASQKYQK